MKISSNIARPLHNLFRIRMNDVTSNRLELIFIESYASVTDRYLHAMTEYVFEDDFCSELENHTDYKYTLYLCVETEYDSEDFAL